jgi:hypothetical protein
MNLKWAYAVYFRLKVTSCNYKRALYLINSVVSTTSLIPGGDPEVTLVNTELNLQIPQKREMYASVERLSASQESGFIVL